MMVDRALTSLQKKHDLAIERIDILVSPKRAWTNRIRMIPALKSGNRILSGIFLSKKEIEEFIADVTHAAG